MDLSWKQRKEELKFLEAGHHLRALNQLMWQVPSMSIAITGGLWYGTTLIDHTLARALLFVFAALVNLLTIGIIWRLRNIISKHIFIQSKILGNPEPPEIWKKYVVAVCWSVSLLSGSALSVAAAFHPNISSKNIDSKVPQTCCAVNVEVLGNCNNPNPQNILIDPKPKPKPKCKP